MKGDVVGNVFAYAQIFVFVRVCKSRQVTAEIVRENRHPGTLLHIGVINRILGEVCGGHTRLRRNSKADEYFGLLWTKYMS